MDNKKTKYLVLDTKTDTIEYYILVSTKKDKVKYELTYSKFSEWNYPKDVILTILDDGDHMEINFESGKKDITNIGYDEAMDLTILLNFIRKNDRVFCPKYKIIKHK